MNRYAIVARSFAVFLAGQFFTPSGTSERFRSRVRERSVHCHSKEVEPMTSSIARTVKRFAALLAAALGVALWAGSPVAADDRNDHRKTDKHVIQLPKTGNRCAEDPKCHNRWHPAIPRA
jgi:hypothetical protein